jgi:hypothetical protein
MDQINDLMTITNNDPNAEILVRKRNILIKDVALIPRTTGTDWMPPKAEDIIKLTSAKDENGDFVGCWVLNEVWRPIKNTRFDFHNLTSTFKGILDILVKWGYFPDDNWRNIRGILSDGGGADIWDDRTICDEETQDLLPDYKHATPEWWLDPKGGHATSNNDIMVRTILLPKKPRWDYA